MYEKATSGRDAFTFSLRGITAIASFTPPTAIADDRLAKAWDERLSRHQQDQPDTTRELENWLARYYASDSRRAA